MNRRRFLRRAAAVGATAAWAAPVVRTITGTPAFAQGVAGSPIGDGVQSLTVCYAIAIPTDDEAPGGGGGGGANETQTADEGCVDPTRSEYFSVSTTGGGDGGGGDGGGGEGLGATGSQSIQTTTISLTASGIAAGARIVSASASCGPGTVSPAGDYAIITCAG